MPLYNPPVLAIVQLRRTSDQSIPDATFTPISWQVADEDTANLFSGGDPTRIVTVTAATAGFYSVSCGIVWDTDATGTRILQIRHYNSASLLQDGTLSTSNDPTDAGTFLTSVAGLFRLEEDDYLEAYVYQDSTGNLDIVASSDNIVARATRLSS